MVTAEQDESPRGAARPKDLSLETSHENQPPMVDEVAALAGWSRCIDADAAVVSDSCRDEFRVSDPPASGDRIDRQARGSWWQ
jgi:hypothetical protein